MTNADFLLGGGDLGRRMREFDWTRTSLGPPEHWPRSLKTAVRITLTSRQPMFVWWGPELINLYNDAYCSILGGKHPEALGQSARQVWAEIWDDIAPRAESCMRKNEGTYDEALLLIMHRNGYPEETYYTFSYSPIPDDDGNPGGIICANSEDTRTIVGERQLSLLRQLAADASEARTVQDACALCGKALETNGRDLPFALIYLLDADREHATLAAAAGISPNHPGVPRTVTLAEESAFPFAEAVRSHALRVMDLTPPAEAPLPSGAWETAPHQAVVVPLLQPGQSAILVAALSPHRLFDDFYRGFIEFAGNQIASGISHAQATEEERHRVEALAELDRAKTVFFSNVSHEFRTPLTLMLGPLSDLIEQEDTAAQRERLEIIQRNGNRLLRLVNGLLDFSRLEAGRIRAYFEPIELAAYTAELTSVFRSAMDQAGLKLVIDCPPLPEPVYVDREMWEKIVSNLLSNAFKFTLRGEIMVKLEARGKTAVLTVRDSGVGIPEHELPNVFKRFHRVEGTSGRTHEGSGIGLALVEELTTLHGGAVALESTVGQGSVFTVTVPFGKDHLPPGAEVGTRPQGSGHPSMSATVQEALTWLPHPAGQVEEDVLPPGESPPAGEKPRVILADDNTDMRDYVRRILEPNFQVDSVANGEEAVEACRRSAPDLLLTDVMMPRLDGFGLLRAIRQDPALSQIPVIMLSARAGQEATVEGRQAGADDYLIKPFSSRELLARVQAQITISRQRRLALEHERELRAEAETINDVARELVGELDLRALVQKVTDAGTLLAGAKFGAFFYNVENDLGESYLLYTLSGAPREAFERFGTPRATPMFAPTFHGEGVIRLDDVTQDERYGKNPPLHGMPAGHLPVRSYLAVPVRSRNDEILGGLLFGHPEPGVFTERSERLVLGISALAAVAIDNARLFSRNRQEIEERARVQAALRDSEERYRRALTAANMGTWRADLTKGEIAVDSHMNSILGLPSEETQMPIDTRFALIHPDDRASVQRKWGQAIDSSGTYEAEFRIVRHDGKIFWLREQGRVVGTGEEPRFLTGITLDITGRKEAEEALKRSQNFARTVVENSPDSIKTLDLDGRILWMSEPGLHLMEIDAFERVRHHHYLEMWPDPETRASAQAALTEAIRGGIGRFQGFRPTAMGNPRWWDVAINLIPGPDGSPDQLLTVSRDITESRRTQEVLRESEQRFRNMADHAPVMIWVTEEDGKCSYLSKSWYEFTGQTPEIALGFGWLDAVHPEDRPRADEAYLKANREGIGFQLEYRLRGKNGEYRWAIDAAAPRFAPDGKFLGYIGSVFDISERRQAEAALERSEAQFRALANTIPQLAWMARPDGSIFWYNQRWYDYTGKALAEMEGWGWQSVVDPAEWPRVLEKLKRSVATDTPWEDTFPIRRHDGEMRWHLSRMLPVRDEDGNIVLYFGTNTDITEQREADRRKDEFLAVLAHELRNPLAPLRTGLEILKLAGPDPEAREKIRAMMERQTQQMVHLIDDLLDVSRITRGKFALRLSQVELVSVMQSAVEATRPLIDESNHELSINFPDVATFLEGDPHRLAQVFANLLNNAAKYTPPGGKLAFTAVRHPDSVVVSVKDTGEGIPAAMKERIFDMFTQIDRGGEQTAKGLGIGLTLVKRLVEMHGGEIWVESEGDGRGSEFFVRLPVLLTVTQEEEATEKFDIAQIPADQRRVLVVDDVKVTADTLAMYIRLEGFEVRQAYDGSQAVEAAREFSPALILMDLGMPSMDGYEAARRIRQLENCRETYLIALTGWGQERDRQQTAEAGFDHHLVKPVEPSELRKAMWKRA